MKREQIISYTQNRRPLLSPHHPSAECLRYWHLGQAVKEFQQKHRPVTFNQLVLSGELFRYLALFNQEATERLERLIQDMKVAQGIKYGEGKKKWR